MRPAFLNRLLARQIVTVPDVSSAGRILSEQRIIRERNRIIDQANVMRARMGMPLYPRRQA